MPPWPGPRSRTGAASAAAGTTTSGPVASWSTCARGSRPTVEQDDRPRHVVNLTAMRLMPVRQSRPAAPVLVRAVHRDGRGRHPGARPRQPTGPAGPSRRVAPTPGATGAAAAPRRRPRTAPGSHSRRRRRRGRRRPLRCARRASARSTPAPPPPTSRGLGAAPPTPHRDRPARALGQGVRRPHAAAGTPPTAATAPAGRAAPAATPRRTTWRVSFDSGETLVVEGLGLVGRRPEGRAGEPVRHVVPLPSREHVDLQDARPVPPGRAMAALVVMDRGSTNGSILVRQRRVARAFRRQPGHAAGR